MAFRDNGNTQLLEVTRRARKLTHTINSWFKVANLDGGSKYIGDGILKDALDLQESLNMSGKLQSMKAMPHMNGKEKLHFLDQRELREGRLISDELEGSRRFAVGNYSNRLQEDKLGGSRSWRSCSEEMKEVIRASLNGRNRPLKSNDDEKASSSRSLGLYVRSGFSSSYTDEEMKRKNSFTASDQPVKMKAPNLIARLMGLEEVPAESADVIKTIPNRENLNAPRSTFHVEVPEARRLPLLKQVTKPERMTLQSMIEREKMEQLMRRGHEEDCRNQSGSFGASVNEQYSKRFYMDEEAPAMVKAMQLPSRGRGEEPEDITSYKNSSQESPRLTKKKSEETTKNDRREQARESERKEVMILKKIKVESKKSKMPASVCHGQQKNEAVKSLQRTDWGQKLCSNRKHVQSRKDVKTAAVPLSPAKRTTTASTETHQGLAASKSIVFTKEGAPHKNSMISQRKLVARNSTTPATEKKTTRVKPSQKMTKLKAIKQKAGEEIHPSCKTEDASAINILPAAEPPKPQRLHPKSSNNKETRKDQKIICEIMPKTSKGGVSSGKAEAAFDKLVGNELSTTKRADKVEHLERLLLSCQSFLLHVELSHDAHTPMHHEKIDLNKVDQDTKLYLGCAEEMIVRKRYRAELSNHPMLLTCSWSSSEHAKLDQLVGEIRKGIRRLANYSEVDNDVTSKDSLYVRLERDLKCKGTLLDAMWDVGWRHGTCVEEADHVAGQLEEHIMSALVEEVAMELVN